jgi:hypothetical protein
MSAPGTTRLRRTITDEATPQTEYDLPLSREHDRRVLAGVKAKPYGWPPASLDSGCDPGCTKHGKEPEKQQLTDPAPSGMSVRAVSLSLTRES